MPLADESEFVADPSVPPCVYEVVRDSDVYESEFVADPSVPPLRVTRPWDWASSIQANWLKLPPTLNSPKKSPPPRGSSIQASWLKLPPPPPPTPPPPPSPPPTCIVEWRCDNEPLVCVFPVFPDKLPCEPIPPPPPSPADTPTPNPPSPPTPRSEAMTSKPLMSSMSDCIKLRSQSKDESSAAACCHVCVCVCVCVCVYAHMATSRAIYVCLSVRI